MIDPAHVAAVAVGCAAGAPTRYLTDRFIQSRHHQLFPWGTFTVNVVGSLIFGVLLGLSLNHGLPEIWLLILGTGFCGGLTTFSTFGYETFRLTEDGAFEQAILNIAGSVAAGLIAAAAGMAITLGLI